MVSPNSIWLAIPEQRHQSPLIRSAFLERSRTGCSSGSTGICGISARWAATARGPSPIDSAAHPINENGQVVGGSTTSSIPNPLTGVPTMDPFLWEEGKGMIDLGTLGGAFGGAQAINNGGQIVGVSSIATDPGACNGFPDNGDFNCHNFLWDNGTLIDLNTTTVGGTPLFVAAINDAGEIIGAGAWSPQRLSTCPRAKRHCWFRRNSGYGGWTAWRPVHQPSLYARIAGRSDIQDVGTDQHLRVK